jgi:hypothetical protein
LCHDLLRHSPRLTICPPLFSNQCLIIIYKYFHLLSSLTSSIPSKLSLPPLPRSHKFLTLSLLLVTRGGDQAVRVCLHYHPLPSYIRSYLPTPPAWVFPLCAWHEGDASLQMVGKCRGSRPAVPPSLPLSRCRSVWTPRSFLVRNPNMRGPGLSMGVSPRRRLSLRR